MRQHNKTIFLLAFLILVWGINWPLSKFALQYTPPVLFAGLRALIGGLLLVLVALPKYKQLQFRRNWHVYVLSALLSIVLYYGVQTIGLQYTPSGLFSAIVFLQPVLLGLFSWWWLGERMTRQKMLGLIIGFVGVATMSVGGMTGNIAPIGIVLALVTALTWALGTVFVKKIGHRVDSLWLTAMQVTIGGIILLAGGSEMESWKDIKWNVPFMADTAFIAVFVIALGWFVYFKLIHEGEASKVGSYTFLIPLVSIVTSVLFLNEHVSLNLVFGLLLILASILLVNVRFRKAEKTTAA
ncbi:DMT family transporter [Paenibacillus sp. JTLBN-2024]|uniref:Transporter n=1 Tax=Paenibacillus cookii TaxID=157839 RepID=A0ABQ4LR91_9BACL|nr:DMT family transporter [Paenibacillus cookii]KHF35819.1 putative amino-acid metabolite efflux pump [Paenibacillus sp. P1XP2]GIO65785.1 transporter [Paenibacillus cookii]